MQPITHSQPGPNRRERYEGFVETLARRLARGNTLWREVREDIVGGSSE
jgi:hypothetical protein